MSFFCAVINLRPVMPFKEIHYMDLFGVFEKLVPPSNYSLKLSKLEKNYWKISNKS